MGGFAYGIPRNTYTIISCKDHKNKKVDSVTELAYLGFAGIETSHLQKDVERESQRRTFVQLVLAYSSISSMNYRTFFCCFLCAWLCKQ